MRAQDAGIATAYHNLVVYKKRHPDSVNQARSEYDEDLARLVLEDRPHLVVCAGWFVFACASSELLGLRVNLL